MEALMNTVYETLKNHGEVTYGEIERDIEGFVNFSEPKITYQLNSFSQLTGNKSRVDFDLLIDIWFKKENIYDVDKTMKAIDKDLVDTIWKGQDMLATVHRASSFGRLVADPDPQIMRRQASYTIRYYTYTQEETE